MTPELVYTETQLRFIMEQTAAVIAARAGLPVDDPAARAMFLLVDAVRLRLANDVDLDDVIREIYSVEPDVLLGRLQS